MCAVHVAYVLCRQIAETDGEPSPEFSAWEIVDALDEIGTKRIGLGIIVVYLSFVAIFYTVLILQKSPSDTFAVQDIIRESIDGLEWSHDNTWQVRVCCCTRGTTARGLLSATAAAAAAAAAAPIAALFLRLLRMPTLQLLRAVLRYF